MSKQKLGRGLEALMSPLTANKLSSNERAKKSIDVRRIFGSSSFY